MVRALFTTEIMLHWAGILIIYDEKCSVLHEQGVLGPAKNGHIPL